MSSDPRSIPPFKKGQPIKASHLETMRKAVMRRIRGLPGSASPTSLSTASQATAQRERYFVLNNTGENIPAYSLFAVKKSGDINYPWGPPVNTEGKTFEAGFNYVTNYDFEIAESEGHWCIPIGQLPSLIRYEDADGEPKIGHPIGPLKNGKISIKRCGYVVVAEPDTEEKLVWIVKSNDQVVRVKLEEDIEPNCRGKGQVIGAGSCGNDPAISPPDDPNSIGSGSNFVLREILNLSDKVVKTGEEYLAHPCLGLGYVLPKECKGISEWIGELIDPMCPADKTGNVRILEQMGDCGAIIPAGTIVAPQNLFNESAKAGKLVLLGLRADNVNMFFKVVGYECRDIALVEGGCDEEWQGDKRFLKYENCELKGYTLANVSVMSCDDPSWNKQEQLYKRFYLDSAQLSMVDDQDNICNYELTGYFNSFCGFGEPGESEEGLLGRTNFSTEEFYTDLELLYDPGSSQSGSETVCNPSLKLRGRTKVGIACEVCNEDGEETVCSGYNYYAWNFTTEEWFIAQDWPGLSPGCNCNNCHTVKPDVVPDPVTGPFLIKVDCTCKTSADPCCGKVCPVEDISTVELEEIATVTRVWVGDADSSGRKCLKELSITLIGFGICDIGDETDLICSNPCPQ